MPAENGPNKPQQTRSATIGDRAVSGHGRPVRMLLIATCGGPSPFDGTYLVEYDPDVAGEDPEGRPMQAHLVTTSDPARARVFANFTEAAECWRRVAKPPHDKRADGRPNRPLTAFSVTFEPTDREPTS